MRNVTIPKKVKVMTQYLEWVIFVALAASFGVMLLKKWGIAEYMQVHGDKCISQLFSCDFCMSFWASFIIVVAVMCATNQASLIFVPVFSTPIARMLL